MRRVFVIRYVRECRDMSPTLRVCRVSVCESDCAWCGLSFGRNYYVMLYVLSECPSRLVLDIFLVLKAQPGRLAVLPRLSVGRLGRPNPLSKQS